MQEVCNKKMVADKITDVIIQRYIDYTGDEKIIKNGKKEIWLKTR